MAHSPDGLKDHGWSDHSQELGVSSRWLTWAFPRPLAKKGAAVTLGVSVLEVRPLKK